jgi:hypothetical protein
VTNHWKISSADILICLVCLLIFIGISWPEIGHPDQSIWGNGGDSFQFPWNFYWVRTWITQPQVTLYHTDLLFYPAGADLYFHDLSLLNAVLSVPFQPFMDLITIHNLLILLHTILSAWAMYRLILLFVSEKIIAAMGGLAFAYAPHRLAHLHGHLSLLATEWIPLFLICLVKLAKPPDSLSSNSKDKWWLIGAATSFFAASQSSYYFAVMIAVSTAPFIIGHYIDRKSIPSFYSIKRFTVAALLTILLTTPLCIPLIQHFQNQGNSYTQTDQFTQTFSVDPRSYLLPSPFHPLWGDGLLSVLPEGNFHGGLVEGTVTTGYVILILGLIGFFSRWGSWRWRLMGLTGFIFSLGPSLQIGSQSKSLNLPYIWLSEIPLLNIGRVPGRFSLVVLIALIALSSETLSQLPFKGRRKPILLFILGLCLFELWIKPFPSEKVTVPSTIEYLAETSDKDPVLVTVMDNKRHMYYQTLHGHPISTGYLSRRNPSDQTQYESVMTHISYQYLLGDKDIISRKQALIGILNHHGFRYLWTPNDHYLIPNPTREDVMTQLIRLMPFTLLASDPTSLLFYIPDNQSNDPIVVLGAGWSDWKEIDGYRGRYPQPAGHLTVLKSKLEPSKLKIDFQLAPDAEIVVLLDNTPCVSSRNNSDVILSDTVIVDLPGKQPACKLTIECGHKSADMRCPGLWIRSCESLSGSTLHAPANRNGTTDD